MSLCIVDCSGTSVPTVMGSLQIPAVSRESAGRRSSPPRGVRVVLCGHRSFIVARQIGGRRLPLLSGTHNRGAIVPSIRQP